MKKPLDLLLVLLIVTIGLQAEGNSHFRFQIEVYGGVSSADPADLNLALTAEEEMTYFNYNNYYYYLERINYIDSFSYTRKGAYQRIKHFLPMGFRIKVNINSTFAFSLGMKYLSRTQSSYPKEEFTAIENSGTTSLEVVDYSPIQLSMSGLSFYAGLHIGKDLGRIFRIEGYMAAGPVYGDFTYSYALKDNMYYGDSGVELSQEISQELQGEGHGFAVDVGIQFYINLTKHFRLFLMSSGSYQQVKSLSGHGWLNAFGYPEHWEGEVFLIKEPQSAPWGYQEITNISNNDFLVEYFKDRKMRLNLSGWSINIGMAFRI